MADNLDLMINISVFLYCNT